MSTAPTITTVEEAQKVAGIRLIPKTGKYEVTISHRRLPKGRAYANFDDIITAANYKVRRVNELQAGIVLPELLPKTESGSATQLSVVLRHYLNADNSKIAKSDRPMVEALQNEAKGCMTDLTTRWVDNWVREMKGKRLAPGTIRKKVESLARAVDWWFRDQHQDGDRPANPLRGLPKGYSSYEERDVNPGEELPVDVSRDRRLHPGEYERIEQFILGQAKHPKKERPWGKDEDRQQFLLMFRVSVHTGMRLREVYRMRVRDVKFGLRTIHVPKSKTGKARDIPMTRQLETWLREAIGDRPAEAVVLPFWDGDNSEEVLKATTERLSKRYARLFEHAECEDLIEHDLRHEATCRWMELKDEQGRWLYRPEEVRRITGHKNVQMFERYLSLRGSDLAERLD
jgi:integrase